MDLKSILSDISTENLLSIKRDIDLILKTRKPIGHKLSEIGLSTRAINVLSGAGIVFVEDLSEYSKSEFLGFRNIGGKTIVETKELMLKYNVKFSEFTLR